MILVHKPTLFEAHEVTDEVFDKGGECLPRFWNTLWRGGKITRAFLEDKTPVIIVAVMGEPKAGYYSGFVNSSYFARKGDWLVSDSQGFCYIFRKKSDIYTYFFPYNSNLDGEG
jgi:hypothetical protein